MKRLLDSDTLVCLGILLTFLSLAVLLFISLSKLLAVMVVGVAIFLCGLVKDRKPLY